jgi:hypothetical protein
MRAAPAVSVVADDGGLGRAAAAGVVGLAAVVTLRWAWLWLAVPLEGLSAWSGAGWVVAAIGATLCGAWVWRHAGSGPVRLSWDGACWHWQAGAAAPQAGRVRVVFDLGRCLLLAFDPDPPASAGRPQGGRAAWPPRRWTAWRGSARRWRVIDDAAAQAARAALYAAAPAAQATA